MKIYDYDCVVDENGKVAFGAVGFGVDRRTVYPYRWSANQKAWVRVSVTPDVLRRGIRRGHYKLW